MPTILTRQMTGLLILSNSLHWFPRFWWRRICWRICQHAHDAYGRNFATIYADFLGTSARSCPLWRMAKCVCVLNNLLHFMNLVASASHLFGQRVSVHFGEVVMICRCERMLVHTTRGQHWGCWENYGMAPCESECHPLKLAHLLRVLLWVFFLPADRGCCTQIFYETAVWLVFSPRRALALLRDVSSPSSYVTIFFSDLCLLLIYT